MTLRLAFRRAPKVLGQLSRGLGDQEFLKVFGHVLVNFGLGVNNVLPEASAGGFDVSEPILGWVVEQLRIERPKK